MNTEIYTCAQRACATLRATHKSRIGQFQIRGEERKKHMGECDEETERGNVDLVYGRIERMLDASKMSGLTRKQYSDWKR